MGVGVCSKVEVGGKVQTTNAQALDLAADVAGLDEEYEDDEDIYYDDSSSATGSATTGVNPGEPGGLQRSGKGIVMLQDEVSFEPAEEIPDGVYDISKLIRPYAVFKEGLLPNEDVTVRIGPVVGKVTDTSATILLEVATPAEVSLNFARIYEPQVSQPPEGSKEFSDSVAWAKRVPLLARAAEDMLYCAEGSCSLCHVMEPGKPSTFEVWGLEPSTCYLAVLSNVSQEDMNTRVARFRTLPSRVESLRLAAVCGNRTPQQYMGEDNPWCSLLDLAQTGPEIQIVLHVGSTIDLAPTMAKTASTLREISSYKEGMRRELEGNAKKTLRGVYGDTWGAEEGLRCVLAEVGANLPVFSPACDLESLLRGFVASEPSPPMETAEEWRALLRTSVDVYYDYQRSLWHKSESMPKTTRLPKTTDMETSDDEAIVDVFKTVASPAGTNVLEEWHFHKYGRIGIFMMDIRGNRFHADGRLYHPQDGTHETCSLLSKQQWTALEDAMKDESLQVLLLVSDTPFIAEDTNYASKGVDYSREPTVSEKKDKKKGANAPKEAESPEQKDPTSLKPRQYPLGKYFDWMSRPNDIGRLLADLFAWKHHNYPSREVVLISAGPNFGTFGDILDHKLGLSIPVVITGPICGQVFTPASWALSGSLANGRYTYVFQKPLNQNNFCTIDVDFANQQKPNVDVQFVSVPLAEYITFEQPPTMAGSLPITIANPAPPSALLALPAPQFALSNFGQQGGAGASAEEGPDALLAAMLK